MRSVLVALLIAFTTTACNPYVVASRTDTRVASSRILETETRFDVQAVALADGNLEIALERTCEEVLEIDTEVLNIDTVRYETSTAWWAVVGVAALAVGVIGAAWGSIDDSCEFFGNDPDFGCSERDLTRIEDEEARAGAVTAVSIISTVALAGGVLYYDLNEGENETVTDRRTEKKAEVKPCSDRWAAGDASLTSSAVGTKFTGKSLGDGKVVVDVSSAAAGFWNSEEPLQLQIPDSQSWISITLPASVRSAGLNLSTDAPKTGRAYIHYNGDKEYRDLLKAGTTRVQSVLSSGRRFQFVSDSDTRSRIEKVVAEGGGNPEDRQRKLLAAARQENIQQVFVVSVNPLFDKQVMLVLTAHDTVSGDQVFTKDAPADLSEAFKALEQFDTLGAGYLEWERQ